MISYSCSHKFTNLAKDDCIPMETTLTRPRRSELPYSSDEDVALFRGYRNFEEAIQRLPASVKRGAALLDEAIGNRGMMSPRFMPIVRRITTESTEEDVANILKVLYEQRRKLPASIREEADMVISPLECAIGIRIRPSLLEKRGPQISRERELEQAEKSRWERLKMMQENVPKGGKLPRLASLSRFVRRLAHLLKG